MRSHLIRLSVIFASLTAFGFGQSRTIVSHEVPVLGLIAAGIVAGGVFSVLKMRHQK